MTHGLNNRFFCIAPLALAGFTGAFALDVVPATLTEAVIDALAFAGVFSLGATGLAILRTGNVRLTASGLSASVLSVISLARASIDNSVLIPIGILNFVFAVGLFARALWLLRTMPGPPSPRGNGDKPTGPW
jgi:hypothetical protein